jgi:uncharacterized membrane protein
LKRAALLFVASALLAGTSARAECEYDISAFNTGCPQSANLSPLRITDEGWVIGTYNQCGTLNQRGYLWTPKDGFRDLPPPPGYKESTPWSVSNSGVVVGSVTLPSGVYRGCVWIDAVPSLVPEVPNTGSKAVAMLSDGTLVGYSLSPWQSPQCIGWSEGEQIDLPDELMVRGIVTDEFRSASSNDWVCGVQEFGPVPGDLIFRMKGDFFEVEATSGVYTLVHANAINRSGVIAGSFSISIDEDIGLEEAYSFRYDGAIHPVPTLPGYTGSSPNSINDVGVIVGRAYCLQGTCASQLPEKPVLWRGTTITRLEDILPPFNGSIWGVRGINNRGQLLLYGSYYDIPAGGYAAMIATPKNVPAGDISVDCTVDADDLALLLGSWGPREDAPVREADLDGDGEIGPLDLAILLGAWSPPG